VISPDYCQTMARYNAWQNNGLRKMVPDMDHDALYQDRGAFFGSIMRTLNHILWADMLWLHRFGAGAAPDVTPEDSFDMAPTRAVWAADRFRIDGKITAWAESLQTIDLVGDLEWTSTVGGTFTEKRWVCATHFFNHQTHHRGQVHAMLTAAGQKPQDTDLSYLPEDD